MHCCTVKMCVMGFMVIHALCTFTGLYISTFCSTDDDLKTERHNSLHCQFTRSMKTQQKEEKTDILLSFYLPFFFMPFFVSLIFFFLNWCHTIAILILIEKFGRKLQGVIFVPCLGIYWPILTPHNGLKI